MVVSETALENPSKVGLTSDQGLSGRHRVVTHSCGGRADGARTKDVCVIRGCERRRQRRASSVTVGAPWVGSIGRSGKPTAGKARSRGGGGRPRNPPGRSNRPAPSRLARKR